MVTYLGRIWEGIQKGVVEKDILSANKSGEKKTFEHFNSIHKETRDAQANFSTPTSLNILLEQRCPTVFFCSPQLWRMNMAIRHIFVAD